MNIFRDQRNRNALSKGLIHGILLFGVFGMIFPFLWMISTSFKDSIEIIKNPYSFLPQGFKWQNYVKAWNAQPFGRYFINTIGTSVVTTAGQLLTSALAAYAFAFFHFPFKTVLFFIFLGTMMIPQQALLIPNYVILARLGWCSGPSTYLGLVVPWLASVFGIFLLRQFFMTLPRDLYEAARIDGCTKLGFFFRILLPLSVPSLVTVGIFTFLGTWNSFLWALMVASEKDYYTLQVGLSYFASDSGTEWHLLMAAATFSILPLVIIYLMAQKHFIEGIARTGMKD